jgi:hypothetical protein
MAAPATEASVRDWRYGNTQAERLCAAMLYLESFQDVDPQHPLGGPDGLKDVGAPRMERPGLPLHIFRLRIRHLKRFRKNLITTSPVWLPMALKHLRFL